MLGDLAAGAEPDAVVSSDVVEELDESEHAGRAADQAVVECDAHHLGLFGAFLLHQVEAVDHVAGALVGGLTRIGRDEMLALVDVDPERQLVAEIVDEWISSTIAANKALE
jgi:hypothetical protein